MSFFVLSLARSHRVPRSHPLLIDFKWNSGTLWVSTIEITRLGCRVRKENYRRWSALGEHEIDVRWRAKTGFWGEILNLSLWNSVRWLAAKLTSITLKERQRKRERERERTKLCKPSKKERKKRFLCSPIISHRFWISSLFKWPFRPVTIFVVLNFKSAISIGSQLAANLSQPELVTVIEQSLHFALFAFTVTMYRHQNARANIYAGQTAIARVSWEKK